MSVNNYQAHLLVLPEDRANSEIATGFLLNPQLNQRSIQVLPFARGWRTVIERFVRDYVPTMGKYPHRLIVLLIDFDGDENRLDHVKREIPEDLKERVFVLGVLSEPEKLRRGTGKNFEEIGEALARDCPRDVNDLWNHDLLKHNRTELDRVITAVRVFLFD